MPKVLAETEVDVVIRLSLYARHGWGRDARAIRDKWRANPQAQEQDLLGIARDVQDLIKRHVYPHSQHIDGMELKVAQHFECEHCRNRWTETSDKYNGGCCAKDEDGNPDAVPAAQEA